MPIRVFLVDDHTLFRQALRLLLECVADIRVVGEMQEGGQLGLTLDRLAVDVVLMDLAMPGVNGLEALRALRKRHPQQCVLMLSTCTDPSFIAELLQAGAKGYVVKTSASEELVNAITAVASGHSYCCPVATAALLPTPPKSALSAANARPRLALGEREKQVLRYLAQGKTSPQIGRALALAPSTIDVHRRNIMSKLDLHSIAELTQYALHSGMLPGALLSSPTQIK